MSAPDFAAAARSHIDKAAQGLDLTDSEDRALFRQRLADGYEPVTLAGIREHARAVGLMPEEHLPRTRHEAVRLIADAHIDGMVLP